MEEVYPPRRTLMEATTQDSASTTEMESEPWATAPDDDYATAMLNDLYNS